MGLGFRHLLVRGAGASHGDHSDSLGHRDIGPSAKHGSEVCLKPVIAASYHPAMPHSRLAPKASKPYPWAPK